MARGGRHYALTSGGKLPAHQIIGCKINCGGGIIRTIFSADNEEFDMYVYRVLQEMYTTWHPDLPWSYHRGLILKTYNKRFWPYNWSDRTHRVFAVNDLYRLNHKDGHRAKIPLFLDCTHERLVG